jgi:hypothetical protein
MPNLLTKAAFARRLGVDRAYVTRLADSDRLVLARDGKRVRVAASLRRIQETADPNRDDVRARHAQARQDKASAPNPAVPAPKPPEDPELRRVARGFNAARADKEYYLAQTARLEYERAIGKVVDAEAVRHAGAEAGAALRARLENLPDQLAPVLAPLTDEIEVRRMLDDYIETALGELAEKFAAMTAALARPGGPA